MRHWEDLGLRTLRDLYREGVMLPFDELSLEYDLPQGNLILYGAITAKIRAHWKRSHIYGHCDWEIQSSFMPISSTQRGHVAATDFFTTEMGIRFTIDITRQGMG